MDAVTHRGALVATVGAMTAALGAFLPWLRSGARDRSSFAVFDLVERLGFAPGGVVAGSLRIWPLVPLVLALTTIAAWMCPVWRPARVASIVLGVLATAWIGGTAIAVATAPAPDALGTGPGPIVTLVGVVALAAGVALSLRGSGASAAS